MEDGRWMEDPLPRCVAHLTIGRRPQFLIGFGQEPKFLATWASPHGMAASLLQTQPLRVTGHSALYDLLSKVTNHPFYYIPLIRSELLSPGREISLYLLKGGASKNLWTCFKTTTLCICSVTKHSNEGSIVIEVQS